MSAHVLAIDPGRDGAAVLLAPNGREVAAAWAWHGKTRKGAPLFEVGMVGPWEGVEERVCRSMPSLGRELLEGTRQLGSPFHLVVEGLFVPRDRAPEGVLTLAEDAALVYGQLLDEALTIDRPLASTWRAATLRKGWGRTSKEAEAGARVVCAATRLGIGLGELINNPHACEAACMARWGFVKQYGAAQQALAAGGR